MSLIQLRDIHKTYHLGEIDVPVLRGVSLSIESGEMVALMGASGSGKTTLMNIVGCLDRPSSGSYWLDGDDMSEASATDRAHARNSKIGFVFQNFNLLPRTTALDNVTMPLEYAHDGVSTHEGRNRAKGLLERLGLAQRFGNEPSQLSGGQQQRVAIARALINNPSILLADEPTGALDSITGDETMHLFQQLNREQKITIIIVTHDAHVAEYANRVIHIRDGLVEHNAEELRRGRRALVPSSMRHRRNGVKCQVARRNSLTTDNGQLHR